MLTLCAPIRFFLSLLAFAIACPFATCAASVTEQIQSALAGANRVAVRLSARNSPHKDAETSVLFDFNDPAAIRQLIQTIEVDESGDRLPCLCYGTHDIYFFRDSEEVGYLNYKHFSRVGSSAADGEYDLTPKSEIAFARWFADRKFPDFQNGVDANAAQLRRMQEKAARAASMFPESIRKVIPAYSRKPTAELRIEGLEEADAMGMESNFSSISYVLDQLWCRAFLESSNDRQAMLATIFRATGTEYADLHIRFRGANFEPLSTFFSAVALSNSDECEQIVSKADPSDIALYLGVFQLRDALKVARIELTDQSWAKIHAACWTHLPDAEKRVVLFDLSRDTGIECRKLLISIATNAQPAADPVAPLPTSQEDSLDSFPKVNLGVKAILTLARKRVPEGRAITVEKLASAPLGLDRLALEVALACYDGPEKLGPQHRECSDYSISSLAKELMAAKTEQHPH